MLSALIVGYSAITAERATQLKTEANIKYIVIVDINPERLKSAQEAGYVTFSDLDLAYLWLQENLSAQEFDVLLDIEGIDILKKSIKQQIVYIALDYDDCGDHLFLNEHLFKTQPEKERSFIQAEADFLLTHLKYITNDKKTILYVGSNRQDQRTDKKAQLHNNNGSCFGNFEILTRNMCATGMEWEFNKLLLSDITSRNGDDVTIQRGQGMQKGVSVSQSLLKNLHNDINLNTKLNIIELLLMDASKHHPDAEIAFYFYDDDAGINDPKYSSIFKAFKDHFTDYPEKIPANVTLFLMHFDPFTRVQLRVQNIQPERELQYWSNQVLDKPERSKSKRLKKIR